MLNNQNNILKQKVKIILNSLGLNEKYNAFEYLSIIIHHMLENSDYSVPEFNNIVNFLMQKFNITKRSLTQCLNKLLLQCSEPSIFNSPLFNLKNISLFNRIKLIYYYSVEKIK